MVSRKQKSRRSRAKGAKGNTKKRPASRRAAGAFLPQRRALIAAAQKLSALGLNYGRAGNLSLRAGDGFLITPSGMDYDLLEPADIVAMDFSGDFSGAPSGQRQPSSEWPFHRAILSARSEINAVVHTHSMFATTLACLGRDIPAFHYMIAIAGGADIRCAPYATFGSQELSAHAVKALAGRRACLLAQHGMIALGESLEGALSMAFEVEKLAEQYWRVLQIGDPTLIGETEMAVILGKFASYGRQK